MLFAGGLNVQQEVSFRFDCLAHMFCGFAQRYLSVVHITPLSHYDVRELPVDDGDTHAAAIITNSSGCMAGKMDPLITLNHQGILKLATLPGIEPGLPP